MEDRGGRTKVLSKTMGLMTWDHIKVREGTRGVNDEPIHGDDGRGEDVREEHVGDERIMPGTVSVVRQIVAAEVEDFVKDRAQREASLRCLEPSTKRLV